jgi:hypothetical protein
MNWDQFPLSFFEVDCDGSACGSGPDCGPHVHPRQDGRLAFARVVVRNSERISYKKAEGNMRLLTGEAVS